MTEGEKLIEAIWPGASKTRRRLQVIAAGDNTGTIKMEPLTAKQSARLLESIGITPKTPAITMTAEEPEHILNVHAYTLVGADGEALAHGIKSYAFARAVALRWSRVMGTPVTLAPQTSNDALIAYSLDGADEVDATPQPYDHYLRTLLLAEVGRIQSAKLTMREIIDNVRSAIEDADEAMTALRTLAMVDGLPLEVVAYAARATADHFDTLEWYTLITDDDTEMLGELLARPDVSAS